MEPSPPMAKECQGVQDTLGNDYSGVAMLIGALMITTAFVCMWLSVTFSFSITALVWGSIIVCVSLFFRHKAMDKHARYHEAVLQSERERMSCAHRQAMLQAVLDHGLPEDVSWEQLQALLEIQLSLQRKRKPTERS